MSFFCAWTDKGLGLGSILFTEGLVLAALVAKASSFNSVEPVLPVAGALVGAIEESTLLSLRLDFRSSEEALFGTPREGLAGLSSIPLVSPLSTALGALLAFNRELDQARVNVFAEDALVADKRELDDLREGGVVMLVLLHNCC